MTQVELVEGDALGPPPREQPGHGPRAPRRAVRWGVAAVAVLVGAVLLAGQTVLDTRRARHQEAVAQLPGAIAPVGDRLEARWTASSRLVRSLLLDQPAGDVLVGSIRASDGRAVAVGVSATTGAEVWRTTLRAADAEQAPYRDRLPAPGCARVGAASLSGAVDAEAGQQSGQQSGQQGDQQGDRHHDLVACVATDGFVADADGGGLVGRDATHVSLVVLDAADGRAVARHPAPVYATHVAVLGRLALFARHWFGALEVRAQDVLTGEVVWTLRRDLPWTGGQPDARDFTHPRPTGEIPVITAAGLAVVAPSDKLLVLTADGRVRDEVRGYLLDTRPERLVIVEVGDAGTSSEVARTLTVTPGRPDKVTPGRAVRVSLDDGSLDDIAFTTTGKALLASDATTHAELWHAEDQVSGALIVSGVVYAAGELDALRAYDGKTGAVRWRADLPFGTYALDPITDGRSLYVPVRSLVGAPHHSRLLVFDFDGTPRGALALPDGIEAVWRAGHHLVGYSADGTRAGIVE